MDALIIMNAEDPASASELADVRAEFSLRYDFALAETIDAILLELGKGRRPRPARVPEVAVRENGLPSISDGGLFSGTGPLEYSDLLEPPYGDDEARRLGKFPRERFPALHSLFDYAVDHPECTPAFRNDGPRIFTDIEIRLQIEGAANRHFLRRGEVESTVQSRASDLRLILAGLFDRRLALALVVPIAMITFDFDRLRISPDAYVVRMSNALHQARWSGKAYGANGHDAVLAAATHAVVFTGWGIDNQSHWTLATQLSQHLPEARSIIDQFFAALRLQTGVETGYAQEGRLARGWRTYQAFPGPQMFAIGARHYPETFDNFGWMRETVPNVGQAEMQAVGGLWTALRAIDSPRLALALRRLNAATVRHDPADAILDATIALEILLGDDDSQAISWKLRMRAAALVGLTSDKAAMEQMRSDVSRLYGLRSKIVHGAGGKAPLNPEDGRSLGIETLRSVLKAVVSSPVYLDPLVIDRELLMAPASERTVGEAPSE